MNAGEALHAPLINRGRLLLARLLAWLGYLRLPAPSILPATGALVGIYAGLAAGLFSNLIAAVQLLGFGLPRLWVRANEAPLRELLSDAPWHLEYLVVGGVTALSLLLLARLVPGNSDGADAVARAETRTRLRVIAYLILGGLALFYPIVALATVNAAFGLHPPRGVLSLIDDAPPWLRPIVAALGGVVIARILRYAPEARGGGLGQVIQAVSRGGGGVIPTRVGVVKLFASSVTIGVGGSAGREGPIVQMGGSVGSTVAQLLGFTRRDLVVLVGCGSAGGIAASFNAPIAGAMFALEIILNEFEVRVFAPIVLASVTATMTARALMDTRPGAHSYRFQSTPEIAAYLALGLLCGAMAVAYARGMSSSTALFLGKLDNKVSRWLGAQTDTVRCVLGGVVVGSVGVFMPRVLGSGAETLEAAMHGDLIWQVLAACAVLKVFATAITLGSGASGGTFFPALYIGAMSGGAFGALLERLFPGATGGASSYALVGMAACVAGFTRGPLTAIVIVFELTNDYTAILPLMVACTTASALCHAVLGAPHAPGSLVAAIPELPVRSVMAPIESVPARADYSELREKLLRSAHGVVALVDASEGLVGIAVLRDIQEMLREEVESGLVRAQDVARPPRAIPEDIDLRTAREQLEEWDLSAAPVVAHNNARQVIGMIALSDIRGAARAVLANAETSAH